jgi:hypothetical protein
LHSIQMQTCKVEHKQAIEFNSDHLIVIRS